jgi:hypothetical protein
LRKGKAALTRRFAFYARSEITAATAVTPDVITARAGMPAGMIIISQAPTVRTAMPAGTATARRIRRGNSSKAHTNRKNNSKEFCHAQSPRKNNPLDVGILRRSFGNSMLNLERISGAVTAVTAIEPRLAARNVLADVPRAKITFYVPLLERGRRSVMKASFPFHIRQIALLLHAKIPPLVACQAHRMPNDRPFVVEIVANHRVAIRDGGELRLG